MRKALALFILAAMLLASCASKKSITDGSGATQPTASKALKGEQAAFMQRVATSGVKADNIVASADFRLVAGGKDLSCDGKVAMRRDQIIRLQLLLPIIRTEIARIDFTPDHVLLVDRYHKEYIKAAYSDVSFLADNGISFYSLQALFWNSLFLPGQKGVAEADLKRFDCDMASVGTDVPVTFAKGNMTYAWATDRATARIKAADVSYGSAGHGKSSLHWAYDNFKPVDGKPFPCTQQFDVRTTATGKAQTAQLSIKMSSPKTSADWDTTTQLSNKYKKIEAQDIIKKLLSIQ